MSRVTSHVSRVQRYPSHGPAGTRFRLDTGHVAACQWGLLRLTTFQIPFTRGKFLHKCTQRPAHEWGQIAGGGGGSKCDTLGRILSSSRHLHFYV